MKWDEILTKMLAIMYTKMFAIRYLHKMFASEVTVAIILRRCKSLSTVQT